MTITLYEIAKANAFKKSFLIYLLFLLAALMAEEVLGYLLVLSIWIATTLIFRTYQEKHNYENLHQSNAVISQFFGFRKRYGSIKQQANTLTFHDIYDESKPLIEPYDTTFEYSNVVIKQPNQIHNLVVLQINNQRITMKETDFNQLYKGFKPIDPPPYARLKRIYYHFMDLLLVSAVYILLEAIFIFYSNGTITLSNIKHLLIPQSILGVLVTLYKFRKPFKKVNYAILTSVS